MSQFHLFYNELRLIFPCFFTFGFTRAWLGITQPHQYCTAHYKYISIFRWVLTPEKVTFNYLFLLHLHLQFYQMRVLQENKATSLVKVLFLSSVTQPPLLFEKFRDFFVPFNFKQLSRIHDDHDILLQAKAPLTFLILKKSMPVLSIQSDPSKHRGWWI